MKDDYIALTLNKDDRRKIYNAKNFAEKMKENPSYLEKKMINLLDNLKVQYDFQRIIFISSKDRHIDKFYIADFFVNKRNIIIEVDGKFHEQQQEKDKARIEDIQKHYPELGVIRWRNEDFFLEESVNQLCKLLN